MKIALLDIDNMGKRKIAFPNLPLMKLSAYHKAHGDKVEWWCALESYDVAYKSKVFAYSPDVQYHINADMVIGGGTGYGPGNKLPDEVEHIMPDYSLYPQFNAAYGFLTRGCPRNCPFCIIGAKEGKRAVQVAGLSDFWNGQKNIKLLDPNLLAFEGHENLLKQLIESKAWVDFSQGLDIRLTTAENVALLKKVRIRRIHFAWDDPKEDLAEDFKRFKRLSGIADYRKLGVYVLTNYNSTHEEDTHRALALRDMGYSPYVMVYDKQNAPQETRSFQRWVNNRLIFSTVKFFADYDKKKG